MAGGETNARDPRVTSMRVIRERMTARVVGEVQTASRERADEPAHTRAAVAIVVREGTDGPQVLLIRRAEHPGDAWSGHMAFPGGREDPGDESLLATAIRETFEELALDLRRMPSLRTELRERMRVSPLCDASAFTRSLEKMFVELAR